MNTNSSFIFALLFASTLFFSCKKDVAEPNRLTETVASDAVVPSLSTCKIRRIYQPYIGTALFTYTNSGNPYSVVYEMGGTSVADHFFTYDAQQRLTQYRKNWGKAVIEQHFYKYNASGQIVTDSSLHFDVSAQFEYENVSTIEYDAQGRVIKETIVNTRRANGPLRPTVRPTFTYDSRGNLAVAGWWSSRYDYKINPLRQNQVFQFIHRNYSMNNAAVQANYNSRGLPLSINPSNDVFFNDDTTTKIIYDCQ